MSESSASTSPTKYAPPSPRKIRPRGKLTRTNPARLAATAHAAVKTNASFTVHATSASPRAASSVEPRQAVQPVDHVDRARHPRHGHYGEGKRKGGNREKMVQNREVDTGNAGVEQNETQRRRDARESQAHEHRAAPGKILDQPPQKPGRDADQQQNPQRHLPLPDPGREQAPDNAERNGDAADTGCGIAVDLAETVRALVDAGLPHPRAAGEQACADPR